MSHNEPANALEGELIDGQFRIHHQIGEGGMGTVWAAEDLPLGRMVAAKFLWQHMAADPRVRLRFQREARMTARVRSAHVVQVFAQGCTADDVPYLIMELLDGEDLSAFIGRRGRCGLRETADIVEQVCRGLSHAHAEGLVHRDIKPHNVFLARAEDNSDQPHVKLLDFGIAKDLASLRDSLTACGEVVGSALYSSPEQLRDPQSVDRAADIWALGVLIFEMLTGRVPFAASSLAELIELQGAGRIPSVGSFAPDLPGELDAFFERALHLDARKRWASVEELSGALTAVARSVSDVPASDEGLAFGVAQTLRSSPSVTSGVSGASGAGRGSIHRVGRARYKWGLVALVLTLLGVFVVRVWNARPEAQPALKARAARAGVVTTVVPAAVATGASAPAAEVEVLPGLLLPGLSGPQPVSEPRSALTSQPSAAEPAKGPAARAAKASRNGALRAHPPARPAALHEMPYEMRREAPARAPSASDEPPAQRDLPGRNHGF